MDTPSPSTRALTRRLLAAEAASQSAADSQVHAAIRVCEKLRVHLTRFVGADGFSTLLRRALTQARAEVPALQSVTVQDDGSLEGLDRLAADTRDVQGEATVAVTSHLFALLITFVGEPITVRLVHEVWPDASASEDSDASLGE